MSLALVADAAPTRAASALPNDRPARGDLSGEDNDERQDMKRIAIAVALFLGAAGTFTAPPAVADEEVCGDGNTWTGGADTPIIGYPSGGVAPGPFTLGLQTSNGGNPGFTTVELCYGTGPAGTTGMLAAGSVILGNYDRGTDGVDGGVGCFGDPTASVSPDCYARYAAMTTPTYSVTWTAVPGYAPGQFTITVAVPFTVCAGTCIGDTGDVRQTGVIFGTLSQRPTPYGAAAVNYELTNLAVWMNGQRIFGGSNVPLPGVIIEHIAWQFHNSVSVSDTGGSTCVGGTLCPQPHGWMGLDGGPPDPTITLVLPTGDVPVTVPIPHQCIIGFDGPC